MAAGLLMALTFVALQDHTSPPALVARPNELVLPIRDWAGEANSSDQFSDDPGLEKSLLSRVGVFARKDSEVSFTKLVVVDRMVLEPRVFLSNRFRMAIGVDLTASEADGS